MSGRETGGTPEDEANWHPKDDQATPESKPERATAQPDAWPASYVLELNDKNTPADHHLEIRRRFDDQGRLIDQQELGVLPRSGLVGLEVFEGRGMPENRRIITKYGPDGQPQQKRVFGEDWNDEWKLKEIRQIEAVPDDGTIIVDILDAKGRPTGRREIENVSTHSIEYQERGAPRGRCEQEVDDEGRLVRQTFFNAKNEVQSSVEILYAQNEIRTTIRNKKGKVTKTRIERPRPSLSR